MSAHSEKSWVQDNWFVFLILFGVSFVLFLTLFNPPS